MNRFILRAGAAGAAVAMSALAVPASASSVFKYTAQTRTIHSDLYGSDVPLDILPKTVSAPDFGPFDQKINLVAPPPDFPFANADASQKSVLGPSGFSLSGNVDAGGTDNGHSDSNMLFDVKFTFDRPQTLKLQGTIDIERAYYDPSAGNVALAFTDAGGHDVTASVNYPQEGDDLDLFMTLDRSFTVPAGSYEFKLHEATGDGGSNSFGSYDVKLTAAGAPIAVPLPPAAWSGLATLAGIGGVGLLRRRLAAAAVA